MNEKIKQLIKTQKACVLATASEGKPYCSLMAYIADENCRSIYMVSKRNSRKFKNLLDNPWVSLMIDTRNETSDAEEQIALTIEGVFEPIVEDNKRESIKNRLLKIHPYIKSFLELPDAEIFCIRIKAFLLLDGLLNSYYETVE